jgi:hypothetical protein
MVDQEPSSPSSSSVEVSNLTPYDHYGYEEEKEVSSWE